MKQCFLFLCAIVLMISCTQKKQVENTAPPVASVPEKEEQAFFPVTTYLLGQMMEIKSGGVNPLKLTVKNNRRDSAWITMEKLDNELADFLSPAIDSAKLSALFQEKKFFDQTLNAITLTYDPIAKLPDSIPYQHWDIYIDPEKNTVQRIYLVKTIPGNKQQQLTWQSGKRCKIVTINNPLESNASVASEVTYTWDF